ncbi:hypothetical protein [Phytohabitans suffuscus]|nr:hypothetical protein [Phytohabitans suffuscus]
MRIHLARAAVSAALAAVLVAVPVGGAAAGRCRAVVTTGGCCGRRPAT